MTMSPAEASAPPEPPRGHVRVVYLGPVAPHWEVDSQFGERAVVEAFRERALARLVLLPPHDPQFRRNRERVVRDAERENLLLEWDLGIPEEEPPPGRPAASAAADVAPVQAAADVAPAEPPVG
ncbi:MAG TPA: hypothetical protein VND23_05710 [Acidimicrobiales bacterium]|nr:hypothetical protein [Acidimicrobiales bacterium]